MPLPSPIPHPRSYFDNTGWQAAILDRLIGAGWPEGDERALRELAEHWRYAAKTLGQLLEEADQAALAVVAAIGGPEGRQAAALLELWQRIGTRLDVDLLDGLDELAEAGAAEIESAKVAIYTEISSLFTELELLAATSGLTPGESDACAEAAIVSSQIAITRLLADTADELAEQGLKVTRAAMPLGHFTFAVAAPTLELSAAADPGAGESDNAVQEQVQGDVVAAYAMGSMGSFGARSGTGPTALRGRYGEPAVRGRHDALLSGVSVGVITNEGVIWSGPKQAESEVDEDGRAAPPPAASPTPRTPTPATTVGRKPDIAASFTLAALADTKTRDDTKERPDVDIALLNAALKSIPKDTTEEGATAESSPHDYEQHILGLLDNTADPVNQAESTEHPPAPAQQQALEKATPDQFGDLTDDWLHHINAGGPAADPLRATNGADVVLALLDTWLHGRPRVASAGTPQKAVKIEEATGGHFERLRPDTQGFARIEAALRVEGHGACAVILQEWAHGGIHATTIHNRHGEILYVDAQRPKQPVSTTPPQGAVRMQALALGPDANPIPLTDPQ